MKSLTPSTMRSKSVTVSILLVLTAGLTCTNAGPVAQHTIHQTINVHDGGVITGSFLGTNLGTVNIGNANCRDNSCGQNTRCSVQDGHIVCTCKVGYEGDAAKGCTTRKPTQGCGPGFTAFTGVEGCFQAIKKPVTWSRAKAICEGRGLRMVKPKSSTEAINLRKALWDIYGHGTFWLAAKADGHKYAWEYDSTSLSNNDPLWFPGFPGPFTKANDWCLTISVNETNLKNYPNRPYGNGPCKSSWYHTLCEVPSVLLACNKHSCGLNAKCSASGASFVCSCLSGHEGDPYSGCTTRTPTIDSSRSGILWQNTGKDRFVLVNEDLNWYDAQQACRNKYNLELYEPKDSVAVARHIKDRFNVIIEPWIGGHGNGHETKWVSGGTVSMYAPWFKPHDAINNAVGKCMDLVICCSGPFNGNVLGMSECSKPHPYFLCG